MYPKGPCCLLIIDFTTPSTLWHHFPHICDLMKKNIPGQHFHWSMFQCENVHASWCSNTRKEWGIQVSNLPIKDKVHSYQYFPVCHCQDNQLASVYTVCLLQTSSRYSYQKYWLLHISRNKINNLLIRPCLISKSKPSSPQLSSWPTEDTEGEQ